MAGRINGEFNYKSEQDEAHPTKKSVRTHDNIKSLCSFKEGIKDDSRNDEKII